MLKIPYFKQDNGYNCGPACLQMAFAYFGIKISEEKLAHILHTNSEVGTNHQPMIEIAQKEGFYVYVNSESSLEEIESLLLLKIPIIVHFIETSYNEGHYSVVLAIKDDQIVLNDPLNGEGLKIDKEDFKKRWHGEKDHSVRWIMAINKESFKLGKQYLPN